jgi:transcriptional regulator with XRE-family HTH domain
MSEELPRLPGFREGALRRRRETVGTLAEHRRAAGLSQTEIAARMGTSQSTVARLEAGEVDPRMSTLERYADALGGRLDVALRFDPAVEPPTPIAPGLPMLRPVHPYPEAAPGFVPGRPEAPEAPGDPAVPLAPAAFSNRPSAPPVARPHTRPSDRRW